MAFIFNPFTGTLDQKLVIEGTSSEIAGNLVLNDNYISNDGGDEGIRIDDDGNVGIGVDDPDTTLEIYKVGTQLKLSGGAVDYATFAVAADGALTITTVDDTAAEGDIILAPDGDIVLGGPETTVSAASYHEFTISAYKLMYASDIDDYFKIAIVPNGAAIITTVDDSGNNQADLNFQIQGDITFNPGASSYFQIAPVTKTASGTFDATIDLMETLNVGSGVATVDNAAPTPISAWVTDQTYTNVTQIGGSTSGTGLTCTITTDGSGNPTFSNFSGTPTGGSNYAIDDTIAFIDPGNSAVAIIVVASLTDESGGSDRHYGIRYRQTQTSLTGWDDVYLMHLYGGDAARTFAVQADGKVGIGVTDPASPLEIFNTASQLKISYDASNYADISVASDGHLELATTGTDADLTLDADGDILLEPASGNSILLDGTIDIDAGVVTGATSITSTVFVGALTGNASGTAATVTGAAQTNITSVGTLTALTVDDVTINSKIIQITGDTDDTFRITAGANGATTLSTVDAAAEDANLTFSVDGDIIIDRDVAITTAGTHTGLSIDYDKTGTSTSDNTLYGLNIDVSNLTATNGTNTMYGISCISRLTHAADAGTPTIIGGYFKATGSTSGNSTAVGVQIDQGFLGTDISYGLQIRTSINADDFFGISVKTNGVTTLSTEDADTAVGHLILDADGQIHIDSVNDGNQHNDGTLFKTAGTTFGAITSHHSLSALTLYEAGGASTDDYFYITVDSAGATVIGTLDNAAAAASLALRPDGDLLIAPTGSVKVGVDDTGYDVKFFGASAGAYMEWDQSEDQLRIMGASADATTSTGKLLLATSLTDINANDVIGKIEFQAPHEAGGTDAITVAAGIEAVAQGTFAADLNATDILFKTGHSEAATEKFRMTSQGEIGIGGANYGTDGQVLTSAGAGAPCAWEDAGGGGGTSHWHAMAPGYKTNNNSATYYYTFYRMWNENWSNATANIATLDEYDIFSSYFIAPRAGTVTSIKIQGRASDTGFDDPFKFYFKSVPLDEDSTSNVSTAAMMTTASITPGTINGSWKYEEDFSSNNTFNEGDSLLVFIKKDSTSANQDVFWNMVISGEYD